MLRLAYPAPSGQAPHPPRGRRAPSLLLTDAELRHARTALANLRRSFGGWRALSQASGVPADSLMQAMRAKRGASAILLLRAAQAGGMTLESMLRGELKEAGRCSACGK